MRYNSGWLVHYNFHFGQSGFTLFLYLKLLLKIFYFTFMIMINRRFWVRIQICECNRVLNSLSRVLQLIKVPTQNIIIYNCAQKMPDSHCNKKVRYVWNGLAMHEVLIGKQEQIFNIERDKSKRIINEVSVFICH